jgi:glutaredoxin-related protein
MTLEKNFILIVKISVKNNIQNLKTFIILIEKNKNFKKSKKLKKLYIKN